jgi:hypothetical protein
VTTALEDRTDARLDGLVGELRAAEAQLRRSYARVLEVTAKLGQQKAGAATGFDGTAWLLAAVLNLSNSEAKARTGVRAPHQGRSNTCNDHQSTTTSSPNFSAASCRLGQADFSKASGTVSAKVKSSRSSVAFRARLAIRE